MPKGPGDLTRAHVTLKNVRLRRKVEVHVGLIKTEETRKKKNNEKIKKALTEKLRPIKSDKIWQENLETSRESESKSTNFDSKIQTHDRMMFLYDV